MIVFGKKNKQHRNANYRRITSLLFRNFFTLEEFQSLSRRRALRVLKLITISENFALTRKERVALYFDLMSLGKKVRASSPVLTTFFGLQHYLITDVLHAKAPQLAMAFFSRFFGRLQTLRL